MSSTTAATPSTGPPKQTSKPRRPPRPNYAAIHVRPLPLTIHPLPTLTLQNPLSILHILHIYLSPLISYIFPSLALSSHKAHNYRAYLDTFTNSVHVTDPSAVRALWEQGFFGKGSLSRSEPEWVTQQKKKLGIIVDTSAEVTRKRREERREAKRERARMELKELEKQLSKEKELAETANGKSQDGAMVPKSEAQIIGLSRIMKAMEEKQKEISAATSDVPVEKESQQTLHEEGHNNFETEIVNQEHLQLNLMEAFFLHYALGVLTIFPGSSIDPTASREPLDTIQLLQRFRQMSYFPQQISNLPRNRTDDPFLVSYVVYHHFRSLGWIVRSGIKFAVDWLLYYRGPAFSHAEFAIVIIPSYSHVWWDTEQGKQYLQSGPFEGNVKKDWYWLHAVNRVQAQVRKCLVLVYVDIPPPAEMEKAGEGHETDIIGLLQKYTVREFVLRRWSPNRNR